MNVRFSLISKKLLLLVFTLLIGWFILPGTAREGKQAVLADVANDVSIQGSFLYDKPTELLDDAGAELVYQSELDIMAEGVVLKSVKIWRSQIHDLLVELQTQYQDVDLLNTRIVFVVRNAEGSPWIVADGYLYNPALLNSPTQRIPSDQSIWFVLDVDEPSLRNNALIRSEWFEKSAVNTIEVGITDSKEIVVSGPGPLTDLEAPLTKLFTLAKINLFQNPGP